MMRLYSLAQAGSDLWLAKLNPIDIHKRRNSPTVFDVFINKKKFTLALDIDDDDDVDDKAVNNTS